MTIFELLGPFLLVQALLLHWLERRGAGVLRPRRSDHAVLGTALGGLSVPLTAVTLVSGLLERDFGVTCLAVGCFAVIGWWMASRRDNAHDAHVDDLDACAHASLGAPAGRRRARLREDGEVAGVRWPAGTALGFDADGGLEEATPSDAVTLGRFAPRVGAPVRFDAEGRVRELVSERDVAVGRLPRGRMTARGAAVVARAGTPFDPRRIHDVVLARETEIRGVRVPAGSKVSAAHGIRVELSEDTEVFGTPIAAGARLRFAEAGGRRALWRNEPAVRASLPRREGYRQEGERRPIAIYEDGRVE